MRHVGPPQLDWTLCFRDKSCLCREFNPRRLACSSSPMLTELPRLPGRYRLNAGRRAHLWLCKTIILIILHAQGRSETLHLSRVTISVCLLFAVLMNQNWVSRRRVILFWYSTSFYVSCPISQCLPFLSLSLYVYIFPWSFFSSFRLYFHFLSSFSSFDLYFYHSLLFTHFVTCTEPSGNKIKLYHFCIIRSEFLITDPEAGFDSRHYQKKSSGSGRGSTQPREYNWGATW
jgi:cellulose synthase/poly-beta-1,6-N-acetylglucosamine synthase-like glycosyltransferase